MRAVQTRPSAAPGDEAGAARRRRPAPLLHPPGGPPQPQRPPAAAYRRLWAALAVVIAAAVAVVAALPRLVPAPAREPLPVATAPAPTGVTDSGRRAAEERLRDVLRLRARLELAGAARWGEPQWSAAAEQAEAGDRLFARQRFETAGERYTAALGALEHLEADRPARLAAALEAGRRALEADRGEAAQAELERALAIEPEHAPARELLARARVRQQVLERVGRAREAEATGELGAARAAYESALKLDGHYAPAADGLERVTLELDERAFRRGMSEALAALEAGAPGEAKRALERVAALKPADPALQDARRRIEQASRRARLEQLRGAAAAKAAAEDWPAAVRLYEDALALEPAAGFARQNLTRARERALLHDRLDQYLADPATLYSPAPLAAAQELLAAAGAAPADEPRLAAKLASLERRAAQALVPLAVTLHSDGETEVVVHHVGRLGRFQTHRLELRPGTYTAVGSRPGYRDVRSVLSVQPGQPPLTVRVQCEERI